MSCHAADEEGIETTELHLVGIAVDGCHFTFTLHLHKPIWRQITVKELIQLPSGFGCVSVILKVILCSTQSTNSANKHHHPTVIIKMGIVVYFESIAHMPSRYCISLTSTV